MGERVRVTSAQVRAARTMVRRARERHEEPPDAVIRIANARRPQSQASEGPVPGRARGKRAPDLTKGGSLAISENVATESALAPVDAIQDLVEQFNQLPGIGPHSAQRIALQLTSNTDGAQRLLTALEHVKNNIRFCELCGNFTEADLCNICTDTRRDPGLICVVEEPKDIAAIERTRAYRGRYHVLGGAISPIDRIGPDQLRIASLLERVADPLVKEVILATDPNLEGEATATYLNRLLQPFNTLVISRLGSGLPVGGDLEFADEVTLFEAINERR